MTAPLAHTAIGANPRSSTTGLIQRGGRPVASTNCAPASTAARTAARVRGVILSSSPISVPSTSQAIRAGRVTGPIRLRDQPEWSMLSALVLPRPRHAVGSVLVKALLQFGQPDRPGILLG